MFLQVEEIKACPRCKYQKMKQDIWRGNKHIAQCSMCKYEEVLATITTSNTNDILLPNTTTPIPSKDGISPPAEGNYSITQ